jgi:hypothetical protein
MAQSVSYQIFLELQFRVRLFSSTNPLTHSLLSFLHSSLPSFLPSFPTLPFLLSFLPFFLPSFFLSFLLSSFSLPSLPPSQEWSLHCSVTALSSLPQLQPMSFSDVSPDKSASDLITSQHMLYGSPSTISRLTLSSS